RHRGAGGDGQDGRAAAQGVRGSGETVTSSAVCSGGGYDDRSRWWYVLRLVLHRWRFPSEVVL
ncbi:hypothetical protein, partial [Dietzia sp. DQ11-44]|uniref:hypothetical protein n=2 Tax=unclassified Dietzia TaxID=2617939 RepID=UPI0019D56482